ncbi:hypothetical protein Dimus_015476 [Dionaea muscipula]
MSRLTHSQIPFGFCRIPKIIRSKWHSRGEMEGASMVVTMSIVCLWANQPLYQPTQGGVSENHILSRTVMIAWFKYTKVFNCPIKPDSTNSILSELEGSSHDLL